MRKILIGSAIAAAMLSQQALAAGTGAATEINNTATATFTVGTNNIPAVSSTVATLYVDEIVDIQGPAGTSTAASVTTPTTDVVIPYTFNNIGNGTETFDISVSNSTTLDAASDPWTPASKIYLESTTAASGYQAGTDLEITTGQLANLPADTEFTVYVVTEVPANLTDGDTNAITLVVSANSIDTGNAAHITGFNLGPVGPAKPAPGVGNVDAVIGVNGAQYTATHTLTVSDVTFGAGGSGNEFLKVIDGAPTFPGNAALNGQFIPGAEVTYKITFGLTGSATATNFVVTDAIPANMTYVAGSVVVNTVGILDGATSGNITVGYADPNVTVTYSTLNAAAGLQTILLKATIN